MATKANPSAATTPAAAPRSPTHALLSRAHSPDSVARIYNDKIQHRPLLLRPSSPPPAVTARGARRSARHKREQERRKRQKPRPLSARQRKKLGVHDVSLSSKTAKDGIKYDVFRPLHRLWLGYVREILSNGAELYGAPGGQQQQQQATGAAAKLCAADMHGALVEVSRSRCPSRVGVKGIVVRDTRFVFELVTAKNQVKVLPKEGTWFRVEVPPEGGGEADDEKNKDEGAEKRKPFVFEILGEQFQHRSADRANKKFKAHYLDDI